MVPLIAGILLPGTHIHQVFRGMPGCGHGSGTLGGLSLIPVSEDLRGHLGPAEEPVLEDFVQLDGALLAFLREASSSCPIGYIESRHRYGTLHQAAAVWHRGELLLHPCSGTIGVVSRAVRAIREQAEAA